MTIERALTGLTKSGASAAVYSEDVFSTYLYTGNGSTQTINNGIDLSTKGGLVWTKGRSAAYSSYLFDTSRGVGRALSSNTTSAQTASDQGSDLSSFNTNGFSIGPNYWTNGNGNTSTYASWTFRKQPKFFDIVSYTGTGSARTISHALGSIPGMIIVKRTDTTGDWQVYHKSLTSAAYAVQLNLTNAQASAPTVWNSTAPTSSVFSVGTDATVNASGGTYVAYLFADQAGGFGAAGTDSVVACGSYSTSGTVTLGWEPQFILIKKATNGNSVLRDWTMFDNMRGLCAPSTLANELLPSSSGAELANNQNIFVNSTGFTVSGGDRVYNGSDTYIYLAIRRPMKVPTDATKVFAPVATSAAAGTSMTVGFPADFVGNYYRPGGGSYSFEDRVRGLAETDTGSSGKILEPQNTGAEYSSYPMAYKVWNNTALIGLNRNGQSSIYHFFKRAPGFFDVVCYTGTGIGQNITHNLGVAPELMIVKSRSNAGTDWVVYHSGIDASSPQSYYTRINYNYARSNDTAYWNYTAPTSSYFRIAADLTTSGYTYVAYLFATCPGVSKVFSYTGNGSSQTINCGFTNGARFVLIKRTDNTSDWWVWDSSRGIVSANDPHLSLNTTAAEVTTDDSIDPDSTGFIVNQLSATNINVSSATYIGLAIA